MDVVDGSRTNAGKRLFMRLADQEQASFRNNFHMVRSFEVLQCLRKDGNFCDVKLKTDDGTIVLGHKLALSMGSPYFRSMLTNFQECKKDLVNIRDVNSVALQLLVEYIYTGQILITVENIQVLLPAANLLQLDDVKDACCEFLNNQLHPNNCLGIREFAELYSCMKLLSNAESYIQQHFSKVAEGEEFLSLSFEQLVKIIGSDVLTVPSEEKVFECVICWVNHKSDCRKDHLSKLMEYVRLPFASKEYILKRVEEEPLLKNNFECKTYIVEALNFHENFKTVQCGTVPKTICHYRRQPIKLSKVMLLIGGEINKGSSKVEWYDPATNQCQFGPEMMTKRYGAGLAVLDNCVFVLGGLNNVNMEKTLCTVEMLDLTSSSCWVPTVPMISKRGFLGVAVLGNCIYAVGGCDDLGCLNSAEVFDCRTQVWRMISSMSTSRYKFGIGVLDKILYAVGGISSGQLLKSVECYDPCTDTWKQISDMRVPRRGVSLGVSEGAIYAVGGCIGSKYLKTVEMYRPCNRVWITIKDMHFARSDAGVVALDGLVYVVGGNNLAPVEVYNPCTNQWTVLSTPILTKRSHTKVVLTDPPQSII